MLPAHFVGSLQNRRVMTAMTFVFAAGIATVIMPIALGAAALRQLFLTEHRTIYVVDASQMLLAVFRLLGGHHAADDGHRAAAVRERSTRWGCSPVPPADAVPWPPARHRARSLRAGRGWRRRRWPTPWEAIYEANVSATVGRREARSPTLPRDTIRRATPGQCRLRPAGDHRRRGARSARAARRRPDDVTLRRGVGRLRPPRGSWSSSGSWWTEEQRASQRQTIAQICEAPSS